MNKQELEFISQEGEGMNIELNNSLSIKVFYGADIEIKKSGGVKVGGKVGENVGVSVGVIGIVSGDENENVFITLFDKSLIKVTEKVTQKVTEKVTVNETRFIKLINKITLQENDLDKDLEKLNEYRIGYL